jgi:hypothetical protein
MRMNIEMTNSEREFLREILESARLTLEGEISHSDHLEFRQQLTKRLEVMEGLLRKVESGMMVEV